MLPQTKKFITPAKKCFPHFLPEPAFIWHFIVQKLWENTMWCDGTVAFHCFFSGVFVRLCYVFSGSPLNGEQIYTSFISKPPLHSHVHTHICVLIYVFFLLFFQQFFWCELSGNCPHRIPHQDLCRYPNLEIRSPISSTNLTRSSCSVRYRIIWIIHVDQLNSGTWWEQFFCSFRHSSPIIYPLHRTHSFIIIFQVICLRFFLHLRAILTTEFTEYTVLIALETHTGIQSKVLCYSRYLCAGKHQSDAKQHICVISN